MIGLTKSCIIPENEVFMDWVQFALFLVSIGGMFAWLRADISLNRSEASADRRDILQLIRAIQEEMKDFHGKLERQDAEFKGKLALQDADFRGKLALQDAEFKAHLVHSHNNTK